MTRFSLFPTFAAVGRPALAGALGLVLAAAWAFQPVQAIAQAVEAAPAPAAAARVVPRAEGAGPALWVVRDADSTLYLFGTVHVLRPTTAWGSARVDAAFDSADEVWFEISNPDDQAALIPLIRQHGVSPDRQLSHLISTGQLTLLDNAARSIGSNAVQMDIYRPWLAALTLSVAPMVEAGYDPQSGVELVLKARADRAGKPVHGFETIDKQVRILAGLSETEQLAFLASTLESYQEATIELERMVGAWAAGDVATMEAVGVEEMRRGSPALYQALLVQRNIDWAGQIQTLLEGSGSAFIAVGAAHLAGEDSVQRILQDRGVTVTRE
ncbi:MAG: TraB/GumN family protein [Brevundimonas sp.]|uniref:TraB/GumN family protein n=1 Tax=Brevundimonas sp. TaxID=1871086 RepID=UPI0027218C51|nr:TraB/GumN family protein [Brevundimonas sp.]MDO9589300.1 TraB/GumN family protein [Brevundimonas sp.]MDP3656496.1 TraB/GumN family protein [Brevundimonas sp.]MDZ4110811.1 TraB/GumN family protein [Brevundimonas sp.]